MDAGARARPGWSVRGADMDAGARARPAWSVRGSDMDAGARARPGWSLRGADMDAGGRARPGWSVKGADMDLGVGAAASILRGVPFLYCMLTSVVGVESSASATFSSSISTSIFPFNTFN